MRKGHTMVYEILSRKSKIEQHEPQQNTGGWKGGGTHVLLNGSSSCSTGDTAVASLCNNEPDIKLHVSTKLAK